MPTLSIHPIALCEGPRDSSHFAYRARPGRTRQAACYIWHIGTPDAKVLVDAGARASTFTEKGTPETDLISAEDGLGRVGLKPGDIDIVIVTHLHCDHIALGYLYKNAKFVIQKKELHYARNPHPIDSELYDRPSFEDLDWEIIDGDKEIVPGVSVFLTPGHSAGGQSVEISTAAGNAVITGFCSTLETFTPDKDMARRGWEVAIPLIHQDAIQLYDSVLKVKRRADIILPLHEPAFIGKEEIPW